MLQFFLAALLHILEFIAVAAIDWALIVGTLRRFNRHGGLNRRRFVLMVALCGALSATILLPAYPPVAPAFPRQRLVVWQSSGHSWG